ncbi:Brp/Blh family beta-carotene 15,15'-dioxygenase, partial [Aquimarina agarivorans]|uniref:Brp/Blh family beta-carotene 15,15'-dioxygenase n=1 Tax=Aquimarina agarivorans TaxID=980584 RepID=UPI000248E7E8
MSIVNFLCYYFSIRFDFTYLQVGLLFTIGLFHGVNDLYLNIKEQSIFVDSIKLRLARYLVLAGFGFVLFYMFPLLGLSLFIIFSGYHFGEQHFYCDTKGFYQTAYAFRFTYGLAIIGAMLFFHQQEVLAIIHRFLQVSTANNILTLKLLFIVLTILQSIYLFRLVILNRLKLRDWLLFQVDLLTLIVFFNTTSLLSSFCFYFIFWHSISSLRLQVLNDFETLNKTNSLLF